MQKKGELPDIFPEEEEWDDEWYEEEEDDSRRAMASCSNNVSGTYAPRGF